MIEHSLRRNGLLMLIAAFCLLACSDVWALVTVSGKIRDKETGESIPGVTVQVAGTKRGAAANVEGFFSIPSLEPGTITLSFNALGYKAYKQRKLYSKKIIIRI